ncbi:DNA mismatch repair endonuclease MutL [Fusobacterium massiliense]|jgi:DNA mismatch repair protein mutL|uniref:DNA mismatch repair endonuclease MutL n=1 Tax=Fusobacterium massiliense TaxID=1852365 RepID=UPI00093F1750|nr:DNA mismatch repair endonuclease MutL [Fusobacterium massiliense]
MGRIRILDESVSNAIAAGEVVENPTSMIKELLENSLDAGAKDIKLEVWNGGLDLSLSDSGHGMQKEDLLLSIERHATSKIFTKDDLFNIKTYGFRGEALSSISAVSKMIISSRTKEMENGVQMNVLGGKVTNLKDVQKNIGTQIEIKDLFYNTPARKKFLRKESTEYVHIKDIFLKEALANYNTKFELNIDGKTSIKTSGNGIENTILEIFGKNHLKNLSKFSLGFLGNANLYKSNKDSIFVFINGRSVKSQIIETAIIDAYHTKLMKGKYPTAIVFIEVDPTEIDVNVHPSKKIVKFANQSAIYDLVKGEIDKYFIDDENFISPHIEVEDTEQERETYHNNFNQKVEELKEKNNLNLLNIEDFKEEISKENNVYKKVDQLSVIDREEMIKPSILVEEGINNKFKEYSLNEKYFDDKKNTEPTNFNTEKLEVSEEKKVYDFNKKEIRIGKVFDDFSELKNIDFKVIGQIFDTFILVERKGMFEIYDQHIIHERVLYEKLKQEYYNKSIPKQSLLVPLRFELDPREKQLALENTEIFSSFGFDIDDFDKNEILVRATPIMDLRDSYENIIKEILNNLSKNKDVDIRENIIVSMSCKGAIKANHKLKMEEMYSMVAKLHEVGEYTCPHGRPIIVKMSLTDLEKMFKRKL